VLVHLRIGDAHVHQLVDELAAQVELASRGRERIGGGIRGGPDARVAAEALDDGGEAGDFGGREDAGHGAEVEKS